MKKVTISLFFVYTFFLNPCIYCQKDSVYLSSDSIINQGMEFYDNGEYSKAIANYEKVSKCDPNYGWTCYEMALSYYYNDENLKALEKCKECLFLKYEEPYVYSLMGSILDDIGRNSEGIELLKGALSRWPYNQNIIYNLATCYLNNKEPLKAEELLLRSVLINPYHMRTHLGLAKANYMMGRITQSYLAYNMAVIISPSVKNITAFEEAISQKPDLLSEEYKYPYPAGYDSKKWDNIKDLLRSELSFNEDFEYNYKVSYTITRQSLMLFRKLTFDQADTSIYNRLYSRFFVDLFNKIGFETYVNYVLKNVNREEVDEWNKKNEDKIKLFVNWAQTFLNKGRQYGFYFQDEQNVRKTYHFDEDGNLTSIGESRDKDGTEIKNGLWIYIDDKGYISQKGIYKNNMVEGEWFVYWPGGKVKKDLKFVNDKLESNCRFYHPNGALNSTIEYKSDERNGKGEWYSPSGLLTNTNIYSAGLANGPGVFINYDEGFTRNMDFERDTLVNDYTEKWFNGNPKKESHYLKGNLNNRYIEWYTNLSMETEGNYRNDTVIGKYYSYYPNKQVSREYEYDLNGKLINKITSYDRSGNITSVEGDYTEGILNGFQTDYSKTHKKIRTVFYKNDTITEVQCFDTTGRQIYIATAADKKIYMKSFYEDGIIRSEGWLVNNEREDNWKFYNPLGILESENQYSQGMQNGIQRNYYVTGQVEKEYTASGNYILGDYREYFINGHLEMEGIYDSVGQKGVWIYYYENDSISSKYFYNDGHVAGCAFHYYTNGKLRSQEFFNEEGNSKRQILYGPEGDVLLDKDYEYGTHTLETHYPNGKIMERKAFCDNQLNGPYEFYFPNGQIAVKIEYDHGRITGTHKSWAADGQLTYEMPYNMGLSEGEGKWYEEGKLSLVRYYEQDKIQGKSINYHFNSQKAKESEYVDDKRNGYTDYYSPEGLLMYHIHFIDEVIKGYSYPDKNGTLIKEIPIADTTTLVVTYYQNGKMSAKFQLYKGLYHGKLFTYYSTGKVLREATFNYDNSEGADKNYYPSGKLREIINYSLDNRHGLYELYYENGQKKISGTYFISNREGEWKLFNQDGSLKETDIYRNGVLYEIK